MTNLNVPIRWIHYGDNPDAATGFIHETFAFTVEKVLPGAYRMKCHLPRSTFRKMDQGEAFCTSVEEAKAAAQPYVDLFYSDVAKAVVKHPLIEALENVVKLAFPGQLCMEGKCPRYGGTQLHDDITVEKVADDQWTITRSGGQRFHISQRWDQPDADVAEGFLWPLDEALEQVTFMHCG